MKPRLMVPMVPMVPVFLDPRVRRVRRVTEVPLVLRVPKALKDPLVFVSVLAPRRLPRRLTSPQPNLRLRRLPLTLQLRRRRLLLNNPNALSIAV
jgi:hypothetical protein